MQGNADRQYSLVPPSLPPVYPVEYRGVPRPVQANADRQYEFDTAFSGAVGRGGADDPHALLAATDAADPAECAQRYAEPLTTAAPIAVT